MTITLTSITRCTGGNHITLSGTVGEVPFTEEFLQGEFVQEAADREERRQWLIRRVISLVKEANATTPAQIRAAVENKTVVI